MLKSLVLSLFISCAPVPLDEQAKYDSLIDYLKNHKNAPDFSNEENKLFRESKPVKVRSNDGALEIVYVGDLDSNAYCLMPYHFGVLFRGYCSLNGRDLYACVWNQNDHTIFQLRHENPSGCNRQPWNILDLVFEQTRQDFLDAKLQSQEYLDASKRVSGSK